ncbi:MAG: Wzz/FepE/Etk N-terminal domain-containing protein [Candidatus Omnitrophota bacterium]|nr:Wzz/FepE/Etk N-terminal domain-containing protein [Candidatus Omnitrophota bacterium]
MENQQCIQEDEIDIREYINVIIKRKKFILAIFIVSVVTAAIVSLRMPKIYEITSTIQLGSVSELLIKNEDAKSIMLNQNSLSSIIDDLNLKIPLEGLQKGIKISDIGGTNLLKIKITYPGVDMALKINDAIVNPLVAQGQIVYKERVAIINERLKELYGAIKNAEEDITRTQNLIIGIPSSKESSQAEVYLRTIILQNILPKYENNLTDLRNQRNDLQILLVNSKEFKIFDAPIKPKNPVGPKKQQNVLIAGMLSLMFGVFLAFVLEFWQKSKK